MSKSTRQTFAAGDRVLIKIYKTWYPATVTNPDGLKTWRDASRVEVKRDDMFYPTRVSNTRAYILHIDSDEAKKILIEERAAVIAAHRHNALAQRIEDAICHFGGVLTKRERVLAILDEILPLDKEA